MSKAKPMKNKPELKPEHLVGYLPWQLKGKCSESDIIWECDLFFEGSDYDFPTIPFSHFFGEEEGKCKPIFFPLSDLTKPIWHNGEKFVPFDSLYLKQYKEMCELLDEADPSKIIGGMPYCVYVKLFEWHFDVFGLIDAGLAISVHELSENPYK